MATHRSSLLTWKRILVSAFLLIGVLGLLVGYSIYRKVAIIVPHSYAAWTTGDLLIEYMETHAGNWPRGWEDLGEAKESLVKKGRSIHFQFDRLPAIVKIDWKAEPAALAKEAETRGESAINVVTQLDDSKLQAKWGPDTEPNRKVARYLIQRFAASNRSRPYKSALPTNATSPR